MPSRPNDLLDAASPVIETPEPDCLAVTSHGVVVSSEQSLFSIDKPGSTPLVSFDAAISAVAGLPDGGAAIGLADGRIVFVGGQSDGKTIKPSPDVTCITALAPAQDGALLIANGSASNGQAAWKRDLMEKNASGSVWRIEPNGGVCTQLAGHLAYPYGLLDEADSVVVSESWRSSLTRISPGANGRKQPVLENLPAYPSRLSRGADNAIWLALFAPRSQLVEFVLSENRYRQRMLAEINADYWVAPCLRAGQMPQEPTQQGGVKQLGGAETLVTYPVLWAGGASRSRVSPECQLPQPGEWAPSRRHQLHGDRWPGFFLPPKAMGLLPRVLTRDRRHDALAVIANTTLGDERHRQRISWRSLR